MFFVFALPSRTSSPSTSLIPFAFCILAHVSGYPLRTPTTRFLHVFTQLIFNFSFFQKRAICAIVRMPMFYGADAIPRLLKKRKNTSAEVWKTNATHGLGAAPMHAANSSPSRVQVRSGQKCGFDTLVASKCRRRRHLNVHLDQGEPRRGKGEPRKAQGGQGEAKESPRELKRGELYSLVWMAMCALVRMPFLLKNIS